MRNHLDFIRLKMISKFKKILICWIQDKGTETQEWCQYLIIEGIFLGEIRINSFN